MSILSKIEKPKDRAIICTILGDAGMGKTSLAATFPKPVFIRAEDGLQGVPENQRPDALPLLKSVDGLWEQLTALIKEEHNYKTVVIDSITKLESMFIDYVVNNDPKNPKSIVQANGGYGAGREAVGALHSRVRNAAQALNDKGVHVVFIAHAETVTIEPPDGDSYTRYDLRLHKRSVSPYTDNVDLVGYLKLQTFLTGDEDKKKAKTDGSRVLTCHPEPSCVSKNRYNIEKPITVKRGENPLSQYVKTLNTKEK
tara:strand:- start:1951 stop:2715 length:765 start_codon:yes stop_codon:yes gene_type:complete